MDAGVSRVAGVHSLDTQENRKRPSGLSPGLRLAFGGYRRSVLAYVDAHNDRDTPFKWVKTADEILDSMRRFGLRIQQVHGQ